MYAYISINMLTVTSGGFRGLKPNRTKTYAKFLYNTARLTPIRQAISLADTCRVQSAMTA